MNDSPPRNTQDSTARLLRRRDDVEVKAPGPQAILRDLRAGREVKHPIDLSGARLIDADLSGLDLAGANLRGAELSRAQLADANLLAADLTDAILFDANLSGAELSGANLSGANLGSARLRCAGLGRTNLTRANLKSAELQGATLTEANLTEADLWMANLSDVRMRDANLTRADLTRAKLFQADLEGSTVEKAIMDKVCLRGANVSSLNGYRTARWIAVDLRDIDFTGAHLFRNFVLDQNYIEEFRTQNRWCGFLYHLWHITSDCGRSIKRWAFWTAAMVVLYAFLFSLVDIDYGRYETLISPFYFSVVSLTTLGFGDVVPTNAAGQVIVMAEVVTGYVMLGGLLSIFSNKMASRAN